MSYQQLHIGGVDWHFQEFGSGEHLLICFHGFGEDSNVYANWEESLGEQFTILAVDLPFHGAAKDSNTSGFIPSIFLLLIKKLNEQYGKRAYSLVGHSLGARVLINSWSELDTEPTTIWLLAPDGLATRRLNIINKLPTWLRDAIANKLEDWHGTVLRLSQRLYSMGWIDAFSVRYMRYHLATRQRRQRLMEVWKSLSDLPIDKAALLHTANNATIPIHLVLGKEDKIVDWNKLADWLEKWPVEQLHYLETGHQLIDEKTAKLMKKKL